MVSIYFQTTNDCNLECSHCFQDSGPGKQDTTMSLGDFGKVMGHLPKKQINMGLTGGEIFKDMDMLWGYLDIIYRENEDRGCQELIDLKLQTNGFWGGRKDQDICEILSRLSTLGVRYMDITSDDKYHEEAGLDLSYPKKIRKVNFACGNPLKEVGVRGVHFLQYIMPVGRGANIVDVKNFDLSVNNCTGSLNNESLTFGPDGSVYMCCFNQYKLPGNIIQEPLEKIIEKAKQDKVLTILNKGGIVDVAVHDGMDRETAYDFSFKHGNCGLCAKVNGLI